VGEIDHLFGDRTFSSKVAGVLPSALSDPSIITEVKPSSMRSCRSRSCCRDPGAWPAESRIEFGGGQHQMIEVIVLRKGARARLPG